MYNSSYFLISGLSDYYKSWFLNANPGKTQVCSFHLNNHEASRPLNITWEGETIESTDYPVYLGVTLDRTLSFRQHVLKLKKKLSTRNNLLDLLANSSWGADPDTLRITAMAVCYSTAEYCAAVWARSAHAPKVNPELHRACRTITGTLKATPLPALHRLSGIPPPDVRREVISKQERDRQTSDPRHPLHDHVPAPRRLVSRRSFMTVDGLQGSSSETFQLRRWKDNDVSNNDALPEISVSLPSGKDLPRREWACLNRARAKVAKTADNLMRWGIQPSAECPCGEEIETLRHLQHECPLGPRVTDHDLKVANNAARDWLQRYSDKL